jgi:hypothetical protein
MNRIGLFTASRARRVAWRCAAGMGALVLAATGPSRAADRIVTLAVQPDVKPSIAAMPQIAAPVDDAERRINAALRRLDGAVRKAAQDCRVEGGSGSDWERTVRTPMRGPRFLSVEIVDSTFCGGAHPNVSTMAIVYDLTTGLPVDWTMLLPPGLTGKIALATGADGTKMVTLASSALHALYLKGYRRGAPDPKSEAGDAECREAVADTSSGPPAMMVWLDAKTGGLAVQFDLAHVVQACADAVVIPTATLRREGAQPVLTDALAAAHAAP